MLTFLLSSLQKQHDSFRDWLQSKEKQSVESDKVKVLLKDLQDERWLLMSIQPEMEWYNNALSSPEERYVTLFISWKLSQSTFCW